MLRGVSVKVRFRGRFPCSPDGARRARKQLMEFAAAWLRGDHLVDLELACGEALANCVEHAGGPVLTVDCSCDGDVLITEIRHRGQGFDPPRGITAPPRGALRGYGLFIMHHVLDGMEFLDGGTGLRLFKKLPCATER
ncbi:MAG: ATP-binding protein [Candidatus Cybelea sp.]